MQRALCGVPRRCLFYGSRMLFHISNTAKFAEKSGNPRWAFDSYRRFIQMFGNVVMEIPKQEFDHLFEGQKKRRKAKLDTELTAEDLQEIIAGYKKLVRKKTGKDFPQDPRQQLGMAIEAVFRSWYNPRAKTYRRMNKISDDLGTAVNVQAMVFGNMGETSGTGVGFTRNPATGAREFYGEFLMNAQGEDVVAGVRTPVPIAELEKINRQAYNQLREITTRLEQHYRDVQDFEFTIQEGKLYMLQTRAGKRTGAAAVRIAVDMVQEELITPSEALLRVEPEHFGFAFGNHLFQQRDGVSIDDDSAVAIVRELHGSADAAD